MATGSFQPLEVLNVLNIEQAAAIAVMGAAGSGKSTFINLISGDHLLVGDSLKSSTKEVQASRPFTIPGHSSLVTLIDTPGFDDTVLSDTDVLKMIATWLSTSYEQGLKLSGIIYMHRITDPRVGGISRKNFRMLRDLCGEDTLKNVAIVTTMWDQGPSKEKCVAREQELMTDELFFKRVIDKGAQMLRHDNSINSARSIVSRFIAKPSVTLRIQTELVDEKKDIAQTAAGKDIQGERAGLIEQHKREMQSLRQDLYSGPLVSYPDAMKRDMSVGSQPPPLDHDPVIAVMGATSSGKTTFINLVSGDHLLVNDSLRSCTNKVQASQPFTIPGYSTPVMLIDTPGFDDTVLSDTDILRMIATWLSTSYEQGLKLSGIIYMHRITDRRVGGISAKNFRMLRDLCGEDTLKNVAIVTTMWDCGYEASKETCVAREQELMTDYLFFKRVIDKGAQMLRHDNSIESARNIVSHFIAKSPITLRIQTEVVDEKKDITQTAAAKNIQGELNSLIEQHKHELQYVREAWMKAYAKRCCQATQELEEERADVQRELKRLEEDKEKRSREYLEEKARADAEIRRLRAEIAVERELMCQGDTLAAKVSELVSSYSEQSVQSEEEQLGHDARSLLDDVHMHREVELDSVFDAESVADMHMMRELLRLVTSLYIPRTSE